jgi:zinc protease
MAVRLFVALFFFASSAVAGVDIKHWETENGARVLYVHAPDLPMIDLSVTFDAGGARDGEQHSLALMTNAMLPEGAAGMDADAIAENFESVGAQFSNSSHRDMSVLSLRTLTDEAWMNKAVDTFAKVLNQPDFPNDALERERKRLIIALEQKKQSPGAIASEAFFSAVYGEHPYAFPTDGYEKTVFNLKASDLKSFYQRYFVGRNAVVVIVGAIEQAQAATLAERVVGKLPAGEAAGPLPKVASLAAENLQRIAFPSTQTHVQVGAPGITRDDPDYFSLYVGNHILGGSGLVSRISNEIREKRGLAYSSYSYFSPMRASGPFLMGLQTKNDQADEALKVLKQTLREFMTNGPTAAELVAAKKNISGGFALRVDSNGKIAGNLASIGFYDLPLDYLDTFIAKIETVTIEQIVDAFQRRLDADKLVVVMVGGDAE